MIKSLPGGHVLYAFPDGTATYSLPVAVPGLSITSDGVLYGDITEDVTFDVEINSVATEVTVFADVVSAGDSVSLYPGYQIMSPDQIALWDDVESIYDTSIYASGEWGDGDDVVLFDHFRIDGIQKAFTPQGHEHQASMRSEASVALKDQFTPFDSMLMPQVLWHDPHTSNGRYSRVFGTWGVEEHDTHGHILKASDVQTVNLAWFTGPEGIGGGVRGATMEMTIIFDSHVSKKAAGLVFNAKDAYNYWYLRLKSDSISLLKVYGEHDKEAETYHEQITEEVVETRALNLASNTEYRLRVRNRGHRVQVYLDNVKMLDHYFVIDDKVWFGKDLLMCGMRADMEQSESEWKFPGTIVQSDTGHAWSGLPHMGVDVYNSLRSFGSVTTHEQPQILGFRNFGFGIPADAVISGLSLEIIRGQRSAGAVFKDFLVATTIADGENMALASDWSPLYETVVYGGPDELWHDDTPTAATLNHADFGFSLVVRTPVPGNSELRIYRVRAKAHFNCDIIFKNPVVYDDGYMWTTRAIIDKAVKSAGLVNVRTRPKLDVANLAAGVITSELLPEFELEFDMPPMHVGTSIAFTYYNGGILEITRQPDNTYTYTVSTGGSGPIDEEPHVGGVRARLLKTGNWLVLYWNSMPVLASRDENAWPDVPVHSSLTVDTPLSNVVLHEMGESREAFILDINSDYASLLSSSAEGRNVYFFGIPGGVSASRFDTRDAHGYHESAVRFTEGPSDAGRPTMLRVTAAEVGEVLDREQANKRGLVYAHTQVPHLMTLRQSIEQGNRLLRISEQSATRYTGSATTGLGIEPEDVITVRFTREGVLHEHDVIITSVSFAFNVNGFMIQYEGRKLT